MNPTRTLGKAQSASHRVAAFRAFTFAFCLAWGCGGCAARLGRDYGSVFFPAAPYYQVQRFGDKDRTGPLRIERMLLIPPVGDVPHELSEVVLMNLRQELQQVLPGVVHVPERRGAYAAYMIDENLVSDDGRPVLAELARVGRGADASHVLFVRLHEFRPYPPQRIFMEWTLIDVRTQTMALGLIGGIDASQQSVLAAADRFLRSRRALPYTSESLDLLVRSPREYSSFAVAQAIAVLKVDIASDAIPKDPLK
jgi:hypothetical protein